VNRASLRNLDQAVKLACGQIPLEAYLAVHNVYSRLWIALALPAVTSVYLSNMQADLHRLQRPPLAQSIHLHSNDLAGSQSAQEQSVRIGALIVADPFGLVCHKLVTPCRDLDLVVLQTARPNMHALWLLSVEPASVSSDHLSYASYRIH
jgi:hypothetical protein